MKNGTYNDKTISEVAAARDLVEVGRPARVGQMAVWGKDSMIILHAA